MPKVAQYVYVEWRGGTCRVKWWSGEYHEDGRKRYESQGGFTDEQAAAQHGQDKLYEIRHGTHVKNRDSATPMSEWCDDWIDSVDLGMLTEKNYRGIIRQYIKPYFAHKSVGEVDVIAYRAFRKFAYSRPGIADGRSAQIMVVFNMILDDAVPRLIRTSPVERTRKRGRFKKKKARERKKDVSLHVVEALARNAEIIGGYPSYVLVWTMAMTGMRPGELFGLTREYCYPTWPASDPRDDPDEDEQERYKEDAIRYGKGDDLMPAIRVEHQVQQLERVLHVLDPKYGSKRTLVIPLFLAEMLEKLLASHDNKWVFPAIMGGCLGSCDFDTTYWRLIADGAPERKGPRVRRPRPEVVPVPEFTGKRMYLLRHAHKAMLDEDFEHSRFAVESRMGHEMSGVEAVYSSVTVPMERAIMESLQRRQDAFRAESTKPE